MTLCLFTKGIDRDREILLAMKKRRFGAGKWNGYGGKLEEGEQLLEGACREVFEESSLIIRPDNLEKVGEIDFFFPKKPEWDQTVHVFMVQHMGSEAVETEEMRPQWFRIGDMPYKSMWEPDAHWMPVVLEGNKIKAKFVFAEDGEGVVEKEITIVYSF